MTDLLGILSFAVAHPGSIALSLCAAYAIGFTWHGPLFGKVWMKLNKLTPPKQGEMKFSMMLPGLSATLVQVVIQAAFLGYVFENLGVPTMSVALTIAGLFWLCFTALTMINTNAWLGKPAKLTTLDCAHYFVSTLAIAAIMFALL